LNAEAEQKRIKSLALRRDAAVLFSIDTPLYSPVNKTLVLDLLKNMSLLSHTLSSFERATKPRPQERRTTSDD